MSNSNATSPHEGPLETLKGVSLGQDAWRRLRRNRMAMVSLVSLIVIAVQALFTPLLPLAPPDRHHTDLQYEPPRVSPLFIKTFTLDWPAIDETPGRLREIYSTLAIAQRQERACRELQSYAQGLIDYWQPLADLFGSKNRGKKLAFAEVLKPIDEGAAAAKVEIGRLQNELQNILFRPYREAGFPDVGPVSRWMIRMRSRVFGEWTLGPVAGRDEFGRDELSRVFRAPGSRSLSGSSRRSCRC